MLLEVIFLVLSAVVLTVVGVGMIKPAKVYVVDTINGGRTSGMHDSEANETYIARKVALGGDMHTLTPGEQKFTLYHEKFHEIASKLGYSQAAKKEHYADNAAIYTLLLEGDMKTAWSGIKYLEKAGRIANLGNQQAISDIVTYLATGKMTKRVEEGISRTNKLLYEASRVIPEEHQVPEPDQIYQMMLLPEDMRKAGKGVLKYLQAGLKALGTVSDEGNTLLKGLKYDEKTGYDLKELKKASGEARKYAWEKIAGGGGGNKESH